MSQSSDLGPGTALNLQSHLFSCHNHPVKRQQSNGYPLRCTEEALSGTPTNPQLLGPAVAFQAAAGCNAGGGRLETKGGRARWGVLPDTVNDSVSCQDIASADGRRRSLSFLPSPYPSPVPSPQSGPLMTRKAPRTVTSLPWCASTRKTGSRTDEERLFSVG